jgi:outer membrane protein OmpA-like peptidoglycan-associated protein
MLSILSHYWGWLVLFFIIGFLAALMAYSDVDEEEDKRGLEEVKLSDEGDRKRLPVWFYPLAGLAGIGILGTLFGFFEGVTGAWVATAGLAFAAFSGGALSGAFGGMSGLRWGPLMVAGLVWACSLFITPPSTWFAAPAAPAPAVAEAPKPDAAKEAAAKAEAEAKAAAAKAEDEAKAAAAAQAEADARAAALKAEEDAKAAAAAPKSVKQIAEMKAAALAAAKALPATGPLDLGQCQTALSGLTAKENVKFDTGSAKVASASQALIGKIGATLGRCPAGVSVEVAGHTDASGDAAKNKALSQARAQAVVNMLKAKGAKAEQLTAVGYGADKPLAANDTKEGQAANRRIDFAVK